MLIAFEGPDNAGKTTSANALGIATYGATREDHAEATLISEEEKGLVQTFDRVEWIIHMAYRLAMPGRSWDGKEPQSVFAMPDTHLVFMEHHPGMAPADDSEEGYTPEEQAAISTVYSLLSRTLMSLNEVREFSLFKTVTIVQVINDPSHSEGDSYKQQIVEFSSPAREGQDTVAMKLVHNNDSLLEFLEREDALIVDFRASESNG